MSADNFENLSDIDWDGLEKDIWDEIETEVFGPATLRGTGSIALFGVNIKAVETLDEDWNRLVQPVFD